MKHKIFLYLFFFLPFVSKSQLEDKHGWDVGGGLGTALTSANMFVGYKFNSRIYTGLTVNVYLKPTDFCIFAGYGFPILSKQKEFDPKLHEVVPYVMIAKRMYEVRDPRNATLFQGGVQVRYERYCVDAGILPSPFDHEEKKWQINLTFKYFIFEKRKERKFKSENQNKCPKN